MHHIRPHFLAEREEHAEELHRLTERLTREAADTLRKTGSKAKEVLGEAQAPGSADLLARQVAEYEDMVAEQDQQIRMLSEKLQEARRSEVGVGDGRTSYQRAHISFAAET